MPVPGKSVMGFALLAAAIGLLRPVGAADGKSPQTARELKVAGNEEMLWIVLGEWDQDREEFLTHFWFRRAGSDHTSPAASLSPQLNRARICAVAGPTLHVFFENRAHYCYGTNRDGTSREWRAHQLPGKDLPLAASGDVQIGVSKLWAVVPPAVGAEVESLWRTRQQSESTDSKGHLNRHDPAPSPSIAAVPAPASVDRLLHIVMYDGHLWQPVTPAPPECAGADAAWLAVADGRFHLFWKNPGDETEVLYARFEGGRWTLGAPIRASKAIYTAVAGVTNKQLVFAALVKGPDEQALRCEQWSRGMAGPASDAWNRPAAELLDRTGKDLHLPPGSAIGLFRDRLALLRFGENGPEAGFWTAAAGGEPDQPFEAVPPAGSEGPQSPRGLRDFLTTAVVGAMLVLVLWRRQERLASPVALPPGLQVVGPAKRTLAFVIDAAPAALVVLWIWFGPITSFFHALNAAAVTGDRILDLPRDIIWAWFWFRVMYTVYCTVFEVWLAATPGKRLLGCQVLSESLTRAGIAQIAIRNLSRMVELEPYLKIWPFLFVVFFTRNRQRMGDLLARTIVVERQTMVLPDGEPGTDHSSDE